MVNPKSVDVNLAQTVLPSIHNLVLVRRREEKAEAKGDSQTPDGINLNNSNDSGDESFSSSCINNMVGSFQGKMKSKE